MTEQDNNPLVAMNEAHYNRIIAERDQWKAIADDLTGKMASLLMQCADLRAERDALLVQCTNVRDATDPGPQLVAETRNAFPWRALRGGDGRFMG